jgi:hypothetical protein
VTEAEFFERVERRLAHFDAHLEEAKNERTRTDELIDRDIDALERTQEALDRNREAFDRDHVARLDLRIFIRDITLRNEKVWRGVIGRLDDMGDEIRAQTAAIWNVLDRLEGTT